MIGQTQCRPCALCHSHLLLASRTRKRRDCCLLSSLQCMSWGYSTLPYMFIHFLLAICVTQPFLAAAAVGLLVLSSCRALPCQCRQLSVALVAAAAVGFPLRGLEQTYVLLFFVAPSQFLPLPTFRPNRKSPFQNGRSQIWWRPRRLGRTTQLHQLRCCSLRTCSSFRMVSVLPLPSPVRKRPSPRRPC